ncbi:MAG: 4-hydroxy-3-methylbut-2-enyl diphosphate reductase [Deltaproteobacteria bacterium]|nr:4-hydroxy-3-methylbut-2-enyl diphosphate reductase [Deltaproteobacteria bacterium]
MKVRLAKKAGFCMGVRRAMEMVLAEANKRKGPIFTFGPLIHNRQVLELLESKDVTAVEDIKGIENSTMLIRAHGVAPQQRSLLKSSGLKIIDATCPRVARVQAIIRYNTNKGYTPVIVGEKDHAEVVGLMGYGKGRAYVINSPSEVSDLPETDRLFVVAQTTQNEESYREITDAIKKRCPDALVFDTICDATRDRQDEVRAMAGQVDGIVVVGGYHSGNTRRLAQISEATGLPTFHVETEKELDKEKLSSMEVIGVTAGASTPNWMIKNVVREIEAIRSRRETFLGRWLRQAFKFLHLSNLFVAIGAFSLSHAAAILSGRRPDLLHPLLAFFYVYAMRVLNRFLDKGASVYNDPERAAFYRRHRIILILSGIVSIIASLFIALHMSPAIFMAVAGLCILGIIYSVTIVPTSLRHLWKYSKIKDVPGSKTLFEALAWAAIITLLPLLEPDRIEWSTAIISFYTILAMTYVRSALYDILQIQGDLIVGVESLPITLGERKTMLILKWIVISVAPLLIVGTIFDLVTTFSILILLCFFSLLLCLLAYEKRRIDPGPSIEYLVEGNLFLAGLLGLIWQILS